MEQSRSRTRRQSHSLSESESSEQEVNSTSRTPNIPGSTEGGTLPETTASQVSASTGEGIAVQLNRFKCDTGFEEVEYGSTKHKSLHLEDIEQKSSKELWLIKAPHNFDFQRLNGQQVLLNAQQILSSSTVDNHQNNRYDVSASKIKQPHHQGTTPHVLLPSRSSKKLAPGPVFKGQITITECVAVPAVTLPTTPSTRIHELPPGLKQRFVPFGWEEPTIYPESPPHSPAEISDETDSARKKKKKKKTNKERDASVMSEETGTHAHRKAHKRKIKTEIPDSVVPVTPKKKKKHKTRK